MRTSTATVTVNPAFFREIKEDNRELVQLLHQAEALCDTPRGVRLSRRKIVDLAEGLRDRLALHFALEEAYGYFEDPVSVAPRLCEEAEALRAEHADLFVQLCRLADDAEALPSGNSSSKAIRRWLDGLHAFCDRLRRHESREHELIMQAFCDDIGVGD